MVFAAPEYSWITSGGPAFGAPGMPPRWTSSEKADGRNSLFRLQPGLVHHFARHIERNLLSDHRSSPGSRSWDF